MRPALLSVFLFVFCATSGYSQVYTSPRPPGYNGDEFHQSIGFHNTKQYVYFDEFNTYLEYMFDLDFTIEFWVKIPSSVKPGAMLLQSSSFDINFALQNNNGVTTPSLIFLVKSDKPDNRLPDGGNQFPDGETYYHIAGQNIPYFNDWFHVAIVRNRTGNAMPHIHDKNTPQGSMRMYINGITDEHPSFAPQEELTAFDGGISLAVGYTHYLKIDELRIWKVALSAPEIYTNMNSQIDNHTPNMVAYYDFNQTDPNSSFIPNKARGTGSPVNETNQNEPPVSGFVIDIPAYGPAPVFGIDREYVSASEGSWDDENTWNGPVPDENEIVTIDHTITLNQPRTQSGLIFRAPLAAARVSSSVSDEKLVYTNGHTLRLLSPPSGGNETSYIVTNDGGSLIVDNLPDYTTTQIPIGTESAYRPVSVSQPGGRSFSMSFAAKDDMPTSVATGAAVVDALWDLAPVRSSDLDFPNNSLLPYQVSFQWNQSDERDNFVREEAAVANFHSDTWNLLTSEDVETTGYGTYSITTTVSNFSPFIITSNQTSLPVRLAGFDILREGSLAILKWSASDVSNFSKFEIERSPDARAWTTIGTEYAPQQSLSLQHYTYYDPIPAALSQRLYYRIKMIDLDNSYTYSPVKSIAAELSAQLGIYPNPADSKSEIRFQFPGDLRNVDLKIISLNGLEVYRKTTGLSNGSLKLPDLPTGIYILSVKDEYGQVHKEKILIK